MTDLRVEAAARRLRELTTGDPPNREALSGSDERWKGYLLGVDEAEDALPSAMAAADAADPLRNRDRMVPIIEQALHATYNHSGDVCVMAEAAFDEMERHIVNMWIAKGINYRTPLSGGDWLELRPADPQRYGSGIELRRMSAKGDEMWSLLVTRELLEAMAIAAGHMKEDA